MRVQNPKLKQTGGHSPRWYIRPYVKQLAPDGKLQNRKERIYLGLCSEMGKRTAIAEKNKVMATINRERYVVQSQLSFGGLIDYYVKVHVPSCGASTQGKYLSHLSNHIRPAFGDLQMAEVPPRINEFLADKAVSAGIDAQGKAKPGLSWATRMDIRNILSGLFTVAKEQKLWTEANPVEGAKVGRKRAAREKRSITDDQIRDLLDELPEDVRVILQMSLFFTLRISEVFGLQEKDFNFDTGRFLVRQRYYRGNLDEPKSDDARREIPMAAMADSLRQRMTGDRERFIFSVMTKYGESRDDRDINQHFLRPAAKRLGFYWPGFGFHQFRRQAITEYGHDPMQAQKLAGHAHADMTSRYTLDDRERQAAMILEHQERILGVVPIRKKAVINGPERAKKAGNAS